MNSDSAIIVEHVSKKFCRSLKRSMLYGVCDIGRNTLGLSSRPERLRTNEFWAVDDVSFELKPGDTLGIIGPNGAGKTTILKMLNGIFWPDKGRITVRGKVGALIEVGPGFHPLLTGRENIYVNAAIMGMSKAEVDGAFDSIIDFAGLGEFIDAPVKFYSSGMFVRLGFSIAVHCHPDILLVDEVLAVGDSAFRQKCFRKINEMVTNGVTLLLVSHHLIYIQQYTKTALFLNKPDGYDLGPTPEVCQKYLETVDRSQAGTGGNRLLDTLYGVRRLSCPELRGVEFRISDGQGNTVREVPTGSGVWFHFGFYFAACTDALEISVALYGQDGAYLTAFSTLLDGIDILPDRQRVAGTLKVNALYLSSEDFIAVFSVKSRQEYLFRGHETRFTVVPSKIHFGYLNLPHDWNILMGDKRLTLDDSRRNAR